MTAKRTLRSAFHQTSKVSCHHKMARLAVVGTLCRCSAMTGTILASNLFIFNITNNINISTNHNQHCSRSQAIFSNSHITTIEISTQAVPICAAKLGGAKSAVPIRTETCRHVCVPSSEMSANKDGKVQVPSSRSQTQEVNLRNKWTQRPWDREIHCWQLSLTRKISTFRELPLTEAKSD